MANFSSAFGFKVYLVPCLSTAVDVNTVTGGVGETGFIALGAADANGFHLPPPWLKAQPFRDPRRQPGYRWRATPVELLGLTDASLSTDTPLRRCDLLRRLRPARAATSKAGPSASPA